MRRRKGWSVCVCFTLRLPLTSLGRGAFFRVTPVHPDRLTDCSSLSPRLASESTTNHADNSSSPAATTFQFHLQIPFLPSSPIHSLPPLQLLRPLPPPLLRWIPGTLSIQFPFVSPSPNASASAYWISLILQFVPLFPAPPPLPPMLALIRFRRPDFRVFIHLPRSLFRFRTGVITCGI